MTGVREQVMPAAPATTTVLRFLGPGQPRHDDPAAAYTIRPGQLLRLLTRQLYAYPAWGSQPVPDVALKLSTVDDGRTYRIRLRDGVFWDAQGAREMNAGDFVRGIKRVAHPAAAHMRDSFIATIEGMGEYCAAYDRAFGHWQPNAPDFAQFQASHHVSGLRAESNKVLVVRVLAPDFDVAHLLSTGYAAAAPREYDYYVPGSPEIPPNAPSAGPYRISRRLSRGPDTVLERNPRWDPATDPIRQQPVDRIQLTTAGAEAGDLDLAWSFGVLSWNPNMATERVELPAHHLYLTCSNVDSSLSDSRVRQAVAYGLSAQGRGDPATGRRFLTEAGYGGGLVLRASAPASRPQGVALADLVDSLARCGITVVVNAPSTGEVPADLTLAEWTPQWPGQTVPETDSGSTGGWRVPILAEACRSCATDAVASGVAP
jgi:peptide/nickel transport system substrate-binding protein